MNAKVPADNAIIVSKLAIERCQIHLAHLHALMHLCRPADMGLDGATVAGARQLMDSMESELSHSASILRVFE